MTKDNAIHQLPQAGATAQEMLDTLMQARAYIKGVQDDMGLEDNGILEQIDAILAKSGQQIED